jgi:hypothetical protein
LEKKSRKETKIVRAIIYLAKKRDCIGDDMGRKELLRRGRLLDLRRFLFRNREHLADGIVEPFGFGVSWDGWGG